MMRFGVGVYTGVIEAFRGRRLYLHLLAIALTAAFVLGGLDWKFYEVTRGEAARLLGYAAGMLGFIVPIIVPASLYAIGRMRRDEGLLRAARGAFTAVLVALIIIAFYKALTGRIQPDFLSISAVDNSRDFNFGFLRHGIFWGWPSSHAGVAFALSTFVALWYQRSRLTQALALAFALLVALGAGMSFHWLSDAVAGVIVGSLVGFVAYRQASQA